MAKTDERNLRALGARSLQALESKDGEVVGWLTTGDKWDIGHEQVLQDHAPHADCIYTRWRQNGYEFPFSPYNRIAHIAGLNFVGTAVLLSEKVVDRYIKFRLEGKSVDGALRELARDGALFLGVDKVTYTKE